MNNENVIIKTLQYTLAELAERFSLEYRGQADYIVSGVGTLQEATPTQLSFLSNKKYIKHLSATHAGVVVVAKAFLESCPTNALIAKDPYVAYAKIAALFERQSAQYPGIHPTVVIADTARVSSEANIGPYCVIEEHAEIEAGAVLGAHCVVGPYCTVGAQSKLFPRVTLVQRVRIGKRVIVHSGAVLGSDGFGIAMDRDHWIRVPQLGGVRIGDDCEIGANTCIDCGAIDDTILENDVRLDNHIQIGHNVVIGAHTAIAGSTGIAGSAKIGRYCIIGGHVGIGGHLEITDGVVIAAKSGVAQSITAKGEYSSTMTVIEARQWFRNMIRFKELDQLFKRFGALEKRVGKEDE